MKFDVLIKNGLLYDGTGGQGFRADLGICRDRIEAIGTSRDRREVP
jgi:dihydroorotase (EC 3.5.2.3)